MKFDIPSQNSDLLLIDLTRHGTRWIGYH